MLGVHPITTDFGKLCRKVLFYVSSMCYMCPVHVLHVCVCVATSYVKLHVCMCVCLSVFPSPVASPVAVSCMFYGVLGYVDQTPDSSLHSSVCVCVQVSVSLLLDLFLYRIKAMKTIRLILSISHSVYSHETLLSLDGWSGWSDWSEWSVSLGVLGYESMCTVCLAVVMNAFLSVCLNSVSSSW